MNKKKKKNLNTISSNGTAGDTKQFPAVSVCVVSRIHFQSQICVWAETFLNNIILNAGK